MKPGTSVLLDAMRLASALGVFVSHCFLPWFSSLGSGRRLYLGAHACVIIFFVLSGYVITYTTLSRRRSWQQYCAARLARIYSVVAPAIVLTVFLFVVGRWLAPAHYVEFYRGYEVIRVAITTVFLNEVWFMSSAPPTNMPFWSMAYEFWYYALFGIAFFVKPRVPRFAAVLGVALVCGPKILLLFPVWLAGVASYLATARFNPSRARAAICGLPLLVLAVFLAHRVPVSLEAFGHAPLFYSGLFASDWSLGAALAIGIFLVDQWLGDCKVPHQLAAWIKVGAGVTFSIYLFHMPLLIFASGVFPYDKTNPIHVAAVGGAALLAAVAMGCYFERRDFLKALATRIEGILPSVANGGIGGREQNFRPQS